VLAQSLHAFSLTTYSMIDSLQRRAMVRPTVLSVYLRRDDASQMNNSNREPLLNPTQQQNPHDEETSISDEDYTSTKKKKVMIRIKSSCADSTIDDEDDDESVGVLQEDPFSCIRNHRWLSPSKTSAKALIYLLYATDLAVGVYLIAGAFLEKQKRDDYGYIMSRLTSGLLLTGSSFAGVCLHTPLGILLCDSDVRTSRSLMVFNTSFAFIAVGIYYMVRALYHFSLSSLLSTDTD
jgi:hypothetical protein